MKRIINALLFSAICNDRVKLAYLLLKFGADVNHRVTYSWQEYTDDGGSPARGSYDTRTRTETPLFFAESEAMKRLLKYFGGLSSKEMADKWDAEYHEKQQKEEEKQEKERRKKVVKHKRDERFLDMFLED